MRAGDVLRDAGRPVAYHADLARALGSIPAALMLTQLLYWSDKTSDGWLWKLQQDWDRELAFSPAVVKGARTVLLDLGLIEHKRDGLPAKPFYRVDIDALEVWWEETFGPSSQAKIAHQDGGKSPDILLLTETTAETTNPSRDVVFETFWSFYPRKSDKGGAKKAWAKAVKKATVGTITAAAQRYSQDPNLPAEQQFIPHASTWLNGERWNDGPLPPRSRGKSPTSHLVPSDRAMAEDPNYWKEP